MNHICTFPDRTKVVVTIVQVEEASWRVQWTSELGLVSDVWVPSDWVTLRVHPVTVTA
jgi:hypothetical protein